MIGWIALAYADPVLDKPAEKVDLDALFHDPPGYAQNRCRSHNPDVAAVFQGYVGGMRPPSGAKIGSFQLYIDQVLVVDQATLAGQPPAADAVVYGTAWVHRPPGPPAMGQVTRWEERAQLSRADGSPLTPAHPTLDLTWTCEQTAYPPMP